MRCGVTLGGTFRAGAGPCAPPTRAFASKPSGRESDEHICHRHARVCEPAPGSGIRRRGAKAIASGFSNAGDTLATKADLATLRADMANLETRLTNRFYAVAVGLAALTVGQAALTIGILLRLVVVGE